MDNAQYPDEVARTSLNKGGPQNRWAIAAAAATKMEEKTKEKMETVSMIHLYIYLSGDKTLKSDGKTWGRREEQNRINLYSNDGITTRVSFSLCMGKADKVDGWKSVRKEQGKRDADWCFDLRQVTYLAVCAR